MKQPDHAAGATVLSPIQLIRVDAIRPDPKNRKNHDKEKLATFAEEIRVDGLLQPIVVRKLALLGEVDPRTSIDYQLIAGERRWLAHQILKRELIEARVLVQEPPKSATRKRVAENFHREDLTPIEKARDLKQLELDGMSQEEIAAFVGAKDQSTVSNFTRLLQLPEKTQDRVQDRSLNAAQAKALVKFAAWPAACDFIAAWAVKTEVSSKQLESGENSYNVVYDLEKKGLAVRAHSAGLPPEIQKRIKSDPDFVTWGYSTVCFKPEKWKAIEAERNEAKKQERSATATRAAKARKNTRSKPAAEIDKGTAIATDREVFAALVPEAKLAKRGKNLVCLDSALWNKIHSAAAGLIQDDEGKAFDRLRVEAIEAVKKAKTVDAKLLTVFFADTPCELEQVAGREIHSAAKRLGVKMAAHLKKSVPMGWGDDWDFATLAKCDATEMLKVQIVARLEHLGEYASAADPERALLKVVLGRPTLGLLMDSPEGRAQLLAQVAKKTGLKMPGAEPDNSARSGIKPASKVAKARKVGGRAIIDDDVRSSVLKLHREGQDGPAIAKAIGISLPSVQNIKKALGLVLARKGGQ